MPDPHENLLTSFYESRINEAKTYLKARYRLAVCDVNDDEVREILRFSPKEFVPYEFWRLELQKFTFIVAI